MFADGKGNRQTYTKDVDDNADDHELERKGIAIGPGERNDHALHEEIDSDAVQGPRNHGMIEQEAYSAAGYEEDRRGAEGDDKVQREPE